MDAVDIDTAMRRGAAWLVERQLPDGTIRSRPTVVEASYKVPWALLRAGYPAEAAAAADAAGRRLDESGDIPRPRADEEFNRTHYLYANGYLTIAAQVLGRFDLARALFGFMKTRQSPMGGLLSQSPTWHGAPSLDTVSTCIGGLAALYVGQLDAARAAGRFVEHVWERQPERERVFYPSTSPDGELLTEPLDDGPFVTVDVTKNDQDWYFVGIATVFLPHLYLATGDARHLGLARTIVDYLDRDCSDEALRDPSSGKTAVGGALLYRLTGDERYRDIALGVVDYLLSLQQPSGSWRENPEDDLSNDDPVWSDLDMTAEYVLWMGLVSQHLNALAEVPGAAA